MLSPLPRETHQQLSGFLFISVYSQGQLFLLDCIWDISLALSPNGFGNYLPNSPWLVSKPRRAFLSNKTRPLHCDISVLSPILTSNYLSTAQYAVLFLRNNPLGLAVQVEAEVDTTSVISGILSCEGATTLVEKAFCATANRVPISITYPVTQELCPTSR